MERKCPHLRAHLSSHWPKAWHSGASPRSTMCSSHSSWYTLPGYKEGTRLVARTVKKQQYGLLYLSTRYKPIRPQLWSLPDSSYSFFGGGYICSNFLTVSRVSLNSRCSFGLPPSVWANFAELYIVVKVMSRSPA